MLSINIPVYNVDVTDLVFQLTKLAEDLQISYEIRVYDDKSEPFYSESNRKIGGLSNVIYTELKQNSGRAAIRNRMGMEAKFQYLLFIDADSKIVGRNYLVNYIENAGENLVLCGGTCYSNTKPAEKKKLLRWYYGKKSEAVSAETRNGKKGFIITSNNFLIEKKVFEKINFRDDIREYGHEDTLLGFDLSSAGVEILHIDNPVEHTGLEDSHVFLEKTKTALKNLLYISEELLQGNVNFVEQVYFLNNYTKINKVIPAWLMGFCYRLFSNPIERNLVGRRPNLFLFNLYRLCYFATIKNR